MRITARELRLLIREALENSQAIDEILPSMQAVAKKIQAAHSNVSIPESQATLVGMHQDLFQLMHDFRGYVRQIKARP